MTTKYLVAWLAAFVVMFAIDMLWLRVIATSLYEQGIGHLMTDQPRLGVAALFYLLYPVGLVIFAVAPGAVDGSVARTALYGALFGLFAYGTYDLTSLAVMRNWPASLSVIDMAWGAFASGVAAAAGRFALRFTS